MGDRTWWFTDCPNCGGKDTLEHYEALSSNMKSEDCEKCGYYVPYTIDDTKDVITITREEPIIPPTKSSPLDIKGEKE